MVNYIKVRKVDHKDEYTIEIYFASIDGTVNIQLTEKDYIYFLNESVRLINAHSDNFKLQVPEDIARLIVKREERALPAVIAKMRKVAQHQRLKANVVIYVSDREVPLHVAENITNARLATSWSPWALKWSPKINWCLAPFSKN